MSDTNVRIGSRRLTDEPVSRYVLGNFIELGFARQAPLMWAERLYNRTFRTVPAPRAGWLQLDPDRFDSSVPFRHSGYEEDDWQTLSGERLPITRPHGFDSFKGADSLAVHNAAAGTRAGIRQTGIHLEPGSYRLSIFGSFGGSAGDPSPPRGKVTVPPEFFDPHRDNPPEAREVRLTVRSESEPQRLIAEAAVGFVSTQHQYDWDFTVGGFSGRTIVEISFAWEGVLLLSWCSLMPAATADGWRPQVVDLLRQVAPPVVRFPGGCFASFYDWRDGVGPRARRPVRTSHYWGGLEENDVGIDEFLRLADLVGFEPQVVVNMMTGSPESTAELVEYCNGSDDSPMGRLRRRYGVERRRRVRFWEMDNEAGRKWSALEYAAEVRRFAVEMREVDPDITVMMEFYSWDREWLPRMLEVAGAVVDAVIHRVADPPFVAWALPILREYNRRTGRRVKLANTEWLPDLDAPGPLEDPGVPVRYAFEATPDGRDYRRTLQLRQTSWFYALNAASRVLDYFSYGGEFLLANFNNCANTWGQNVIESAKEGAWLSACGRVFAFFRDDDSTYPLATTVGGAPDPLLKAQACEALHGGVNLYAVNQDLHPRSLTLSHPAGLSLRRLRILSAERRLAIGTPGGEQIVCSEADCTGSRVTLPPLSLCRAVFERS